MNVNAAGPSDEHDIRKAAIETAMLDKEPSAQEREQRAYEWLKAYAESGCVGGLISSEQISVLFAQIKSQADRIAELEKDAKRLDWVLPIMSLTNDPACVMDGRALAIARQFMKIPPFTGREAIDAAMNERKE